MSSPSKWIARALVLAACALSPLVHGADTRADDDAFLLLRDAARQDDAAKADFYADRLGTYSAAAYVDYYRLKPRLRELGEEQIRGFLTRYEGSAIADRFRNDWLLELGRKRDWLNFDEQYPLFALNDDTQLKCYALLSRVLKGQRVAAEARALLVAPSGYGEACGSLITALAQSGQFGAEDLWAQLRLSGETNATGPARRIMLLLGGSDSRVAQAIDLPALALARGVGVGRADHEAYLVALGRMAKSSVKLAVLALHKATGLTAQEQAIGWANIALQASYSLAPETAGYWRQSNGAPLSLDQMQWKTRIALREQSWGEVKADILAMPAALREDAAWTYWLGRALQAGAPGQASTEATQLYRSIAEQSNFYGLLATEELGRQITIPPAGRAVAPAEIAAIAANPGFQRSLKFFAMRLRFEGTREWNWELRKMSEREHLAAAEFARQNNILDRMVNTSDRTRVEVDYTQRYPSPHDDIMHPATQTLGLDKAWVYGLIRQESRFIMDAQSHVGASGLMQVMPSTGRWVAKKIGLADFVQDMLSDVRTNILLGTNYMNMVIGGLDGSQVLATAAYNAGPGRLRSWRATLTGPLEGAIFAETIPFSETRVYVKNVMANATYYAALFENKPQSLKARLGSVAPKGNAVAAELQ
ncbi:lytic transglycosylase domain-containing protein [Janthinobacterium sp.]|uniref:lytic transglycosylase domain-containing protein n=1 Tax=Janthinobacterium sp. TaxID=1871054 RepID=UPI00293D814B|nr:transglycosylase SLT domain-containing protein [Janthinobacterium sp.]